MGNHENEEQLRNDTVTGEESSTMITTNNHQKNNKRSRRVSFAAEITSVHVFDRDDEYNDTPPDIDPPNLDTEEVLGLFKDLGNENDDVADDADVEDDEDDDESVDGVRPFLRPIGSPSPGSTIGSATSSNGEDDFFGPVSANFIRPGRLSDSAPSDDNHEITMDSTAFSMHFRSLARSDSGGESKTPMGVRLDFEEKTPTQDTASSSMVLTGFEKPIPQSSEHVNRLSDGKDLNDMSLVGENPHRYDYARLSPRLKELLSEGSKDVHMEFVSDSVLKSPRFTRIGNKASTMSGDRNLAEKDFRDMEPRNYSTYESGDFARVEMSLTNGVSNTSPVKLMTSTSNASDILAAADTSVNNEIQTPNQITKGILFDQSKNSVIEAFGSSFRENLSNFNNGVHRLELQLQNKLTNLQSSGGWLEKTSSSDGGIIHFKSDDQSSDQQYQTPVAGSTSLLLTERYPENSPRVARKSSDTVDNADIRDQTPQAGSISLLTTKQQKMLFGAADPSSHARIATSENKPGFSLSSEHIKYGGGLSIPKSILKSRLVAVSPFVFTPQDGIGSSRLRLSNQLSKISPFRSVPTKTSKDPSWTHVDVPVARLEERFSSSHEKKGERESSLNNDSNDVEFLKNRESSLTEEPVDRSCIPVAASSEITGSGKKASHHLLVSEIPKEEMQITSEIKISEKIVSLPAQRIETSGLASPKNVESTFTDSKQQDQSHKFVCRSSEQDIDSIEIVAGGNHLTTVAHYIDSMLTGNKEYPASPLVETNTSKDSTHMRSMHNGYIDLQDPQNDGETNTTFQSHARDFDGRDMAHHGCASPSMVASTNESSLQKSSVEYMSESPLREPCNASQNDETHPRAQNFSGKKRRSKEMVQADAHHTSDTENTQRSPKVQKRGEIKAHSEHSTENIDEGNKTGRKTAVKHWFDIFSKFSADSNQLHTPLVDKLNLGMISVLEDILNRLQKVNTVEMLCSGIQSQNTYDQFRAIQQKRASETKALQYKMIYEKAKFQLNCLKQDRLLKRIELLRSGVKESQSLKIKCSDQYVPGTKVSRVVDRHPQSLTVHVEDKHKVAHDEVTSVRQKVIESERKISCLTKSFHTLLNMKEELSSVETIQLIKDLLKKRSRFKCILQDLQLWEVDEFEHNNGHYSVGLNYRGFILQRFTVAAPVSNITVSNVLNDTNITKKYPNMAACTAFSSVFKAGTTRKYVSVSSLARETQVTSSLFSNLLDVIEEVQLAQLELRNLTQTEFDSPSVEQLDLQLCFFNFKSGEKVNLTLDMSCLNRGVYPSEIAPSQLQIHSIRAKKSQQPTLLAEIREVVDSLKVGYSRIIRLCRRVSQILEDPSR